MKKSDFADIAFQASTLHGAEPFYVASGYGVDRPFDEDDFLIMVNRYGDRIAIKRKGEDWSIDDVAGKGSYPNTPKHKNAIIVSSLKMENK